MVIPHLWPARRTSERNDVSNNPSRSFRIRKSSGATRSPKNRYAVSGSHWFEVQSRPWTSGNWWCMALAHRAVSGKSFGDDAINEFRLMPHRLRSGLRKEARRKFLRSSSRACARLCTSVLGTVLRSALTGTSWKIVSCIAASSVSDA